MGIYHIKNHCRLHRKAITSVILPGIAISAVLCTSGLPVSAETQAQQLAEAWTVGAISIPCSDVDPNPLVLKQKAKVKTKYKKYNKKTKLGTTKKKQIWAGLTDETGYIQTNVNKTIVRSKVRREGKWEIKEQITTVSTKYKYRHYAKPIALKDVIKSAPDVPPELWCEMERENYKVVESSLVAYYGVAITWYGVPYGTVTHVGSQPSMGYMWIPDKTQAELVAHEAGHVLYLNSITDIGRGNALTEWKRIYNADKKKFRDKALGTNSDHDVENANEYFATIFASLTEGYSYDKKDIKKYVPQSYNFVKSKTNEFIKAYQQLYGKPQGRIALEKKQKEQEQKRAKAKQKIKAQSIRKIKPVLFPYAYLAKEKIQQDTQQVTGITLVRCKITSV